MGFLDVIMVVAYVMNLIPLPDQVEVPFSRSIIQERQNQARATSGMPSQRVWGVGHQVRGLCLCLEQSSFEFKKWPFWRYFDWANAQSFLLQSQNRARTCPLNATENNRYQVRSPGSQEPNF
jgi:hypothetical protein